MTVEKVKLIKKNFRLPERLIEQIDDYKVRESLSSRTTALIELIRIGLKNSK